MSWSGEIAFLGVVFAVVNIIMMIDLIVLAIPKLGRQESDWPEALKGPWGALLCVYLILSTYFSIRSCNRESNLETMFKEGHRRGVFTVAIDLNNNKVYSWKDTTASSTAEVAP